MNALALEDIAALLLRRATEHGATAADVLVAEADSLMVTVRLGSVEKVKRATSKHLGLRVFVGNRSAVTSTADFTGTAIEELAAASVALARATASDPQSGLPPAEDLAVDPPDLDLCDPALAEITPEQAIEWCREAESTARESDARITNSEGADFNSGTGRVFYAATNGFSGGYHASNCGLWVVPVAIENGTMERDYWYSTARHLHGLETPESIGRTAARRTLRRLGARKVGTCEVPVVFEPEAAATLVSHLAGAVCGNSLYMGTSFLIGKLGQRIAPHMVHISDDGKLPRELGSKPFDAEGVATRCTHVVDSGVLTSYLFDTYSARRLDAHTTGNAARSVVDVPRTSPTNTFLHAGDIDPQQIVCSVQSGLYVTELMGFGVNPVTGDYSRGAVGLWIENGELAYPVSEVTIAGNLLQMFQDIELVGSDLVRRRGISAPTIKIARMTVAGS